MSLLTPSSLRCFGTFFVRNLLYRSRFSLNISGITYGHVVIDPGSRRLGRHISRVEQILRVLQIFLDRLILWNWGIFWIWWIFYRRLLLIIYSMVFIIAKLLQKLLATVVSVVRLAIRSTWFGCSIYLCSRSLTRRS